MSDGTNGSGNGPGNELGNGSRGDEFKDVALLSSEPDPHLPPNDFASDNSDLELDLYRYLDDADGIEEFKWRIKNLVQKWGFSDFSFARPQSPCEADMELITLPRALLDTYGAEGFFEHDLNVQYFKRNTAPVFQSTLEKFIMEMPFATETTERSRELYRMLGSYGYHDFYFVITSDRNQNGIGVLAVSCKGQNQIEFRKKVQNNRTQVHKLAEVIDCLSTAKFPDLYPKPIDGRSEVKISSRPMRLLTALARDDLTLNEAAEKMGISIHTANQHVATARRAFGAKTNTGAIYRAFKTGLLKPL